MKKFYNKFLDNDTLIIDWFFITFCNFKCSYCSVFNYSAMKLNYMLKDNQINYIINLLKQVKYKFILSLLGGEPTIHKKLNYILNECSKIENCKSISIFTNGTRPLSVYNFNKKIEVIMTYHKHEIEKHKCEDAFLKNIDFLKNHNIKFSCPIMIEDNDWESYRKIKNKLNCDSEYVYIFHDKITESGDLKNDDRKDYCLEINGEKHWYTSYDVLESDMCNFKGWTCNLKNIIIDTDLKSRYACLSEKNKINNNTFKPLILKCPFDKCSIECFLDNLKYHD